MLYIYIYIYNIYMFFISFLTYFCVQMYPLPKIQSWEQWKSGCKKLLVYDSFQEVTREDMCNFMTDLGELDYHVITTNFIKVQYRSLDAFRKAVGRPIIMRGRLFINSRSAPQVSLEIELKGMNLIQKEIFWTKFKYINTSPRSLTL